MHPRICLPAILCLLSTAAHAQPKGHRPADAPLAQAIHKALPTGATEVGKPLPVGLIPFGKAQVVIYRKSPDDRQFHAILLSPNHGAWRTSTLPDAPQSAPAEEIVTSVLRAAGPELHNVVANDRLVILFYTHQPGSTGSQAHGRVYESQTGPFRIDEAASAKLEGVRTAAVARLKLAK